MKQQRENYSCGNSCVRLSICLLLAVSVLPFWVGAHRGLLNDDTYITLTYAKNLARGNGFVYNHPPPTLGTTTPLLTLLVAGTAWLLPMFEIDAIAVFFTVCCWVGIVWVIFFFRRSLALKAWHAAIIGMVLVLSGWSEYLGMEAYLFAFLLVLASALFTARRYTLAGVTVGLLFLTRGEGILLLPLFAASLFVSEYVVGKRPARDACRPVLFMAIGCALPVVPWCLYAYCTFGTVLPDTLAAKMIHMDTGHWKSFFSTLVKKWIFNWGHELDVPLFPMHYVWWLLVGLGLCLSIKHRRRRGLFFVWVCLYIAGYSLLRVPGYGWYQIPILFVLQIYAAFGIIFCMQFLSRYRIPGRTAAIVFAALILVLFANTMGDRLQQGQHRKQRMRAYAELCSWFRTHTYPKDSVAYIEVGYLGYYTDNRIIDLAGLVTPGIVPHIKSEGFSGGFWGAQPDYYIYFPFFHPLLGSINASEAFARQYRECARIPAGHNLGDFIIYKRS